MYLCIYLFKKIFEKIVMYLCIYLFIYLSTYLFICFSAFLLTSCQRSADVNTRRLVHYSSSCLTQQHRNTKNLPRRARLQWILLCRKVGLKLLIREQPQTLSVISNCNLAKTATLFNFIFFLMQYASS